MNRPDVLTLITGQSDSNSGIDATHMDGSESQNWTVRQPILEPKLHLKIPKDEGLNFPRSQLS